MIRTKKSAKVHVEYWDKEKPGGKYRTAAFRTAHEEAYTAKIRAELLEFTGPRQQRKLTIRVMDVKGEKICSRVISVQQKNLQANEIFNLIFNCILLSTYLHSGGRRNDS